MDPRQKACVAIILGLSIRRNVNRKRWMKEWLKKRQQYSHMVLLDEIRLMESDDYKNYFRMNESTFNKLLEMVGPFLARQNTNMRNCLSVKERLAVTLRYLATGRDFEDLKFSAVMSPASISKAVIETCEVLMNVLQDYMKFPTTPDEWLAISKEFGFRTQFFNTVGAIDGKHIAIKKPANSVSLYYNYKGFYSIVLLALVNAKKEFVMVDAGMNGRISDGGVLNYSNFGEMMKMKTLHLPKPASLPNTTETYPYVFVADEAFALDVNLMKPFAQKTLTPSRQLFNKRLSRARVVVENTFGILASRFGVFQKAIKLEPGKAAIITMACCYLHNFLVREIEEGYLTTADASEGQSEEMLTELQKTRVKNVTTEAKRIREKLSEYYNNN